MNLKWSHLHPICRLITYVYIFEYIMCNTLCRLAVEIVKKKKFSVSQNALNRFSLFVCVSAISETGNWFFSYSILMVELLRLDLRSGCHTYFPFHSDKKKNLSFAFILKWFLWHFTRFSYFFVCQLLTLGYVYGLLQVAQKFRMFSFHFGCCFVVIYLELHMIFNILHESIPFNAITKSHLQLRADECFTLYFDIFVVWNTFFKFHKYFFSSTFCNRIGYVQMCWFWFFLCLTWWVLSLLQHKQSKINVVCSFPQFSLWNNHWKSRFIRFDFGNHKNGRLIWNWASGWINDSMKTNHLSFFFFECLMFKKQKKKQNAYTKLNH